MKCRAAARAIIPTSRIESIFKNDLEFECILPFDATNKRSLWSKIEREF